MDDDADIDDQAVDPGPGQSWSEIREHVERHIKQYSAASVVELALADLWAPGDDETRVRRFPWLTLLVAKWALLLSGTLRVGHRMPATLLPYLKQKLWDGGDRAFMERMARHEADFGPDRPFSYALMMRMPLASQRQYQTKDIGGLYRTAELIRQLEHNHTCKRLFKERTGLAVENFIDGCIFIYTMFSVSQSHQLSMADFKHFSKLRGDVLPRVMGMMSRSLPDLRNELRSEPPTKGNRSRELHVFTIFKRYPFIRMRQGSGRSAD